MSTAGEHPSIILSPLAAAAVLFSPACQACVQPAPFIDAVHIGFRAMQRQDRRGPGGGYDAFDTLAPLSGGGYSRLKRQSALRLDADSPSSK